NGAGLAGTAAIPLAAANELPVSNGDRPLADASRTPQHFARLELHANPASAVGMSVDVIADQHNAAVVIIEVLVGINLECIELAAARGDAEQVAPDVIARSHEHLVILVNWGRHDRGAAAAFRPPEQLSVGSRDAQHTSVRHLDVLAH